MIEDFVRKQLTQLPEPLVAERLYRGLVKQSPATAKLFDRERGLLSDVLSLAAWSPWLAAILENNSDYLSWLHRERADPRIATREDLDESLGRFALTNSQVEPHILLSRFRRRELLSIYLHDIRGSRTVAETTEALSTLADAILQYAMNLSRQQLDNQYGAPQTIDERGRISSGSFCIVALGKLGSRELNYASDIDLMFLYSAEGETSGTGARGRLTNREYFVKLAESILRLVGAPRGEGAAYRIDVRLRPHGRVGVLANSLDEAVRYYRKFAQDWELQTLIRARAAAGSFQLYDEFARRIVEKVFRADVDVIAALNSVRLSKQKMDEQREATSSDYNVKLGRGGIREIEFIAQALQLAFAGRDPWLRAPHTLIALGRLADRRLITEHELSQLSNAYRFLRMLEHRLQMDHGLQTHTLPGNPTQRELVARRMGLSGNEAVKDFDLALGSHTDNVRATFERIFAGAEVTKPASRSAKVSANFSAPESALARAAAASLLKHYPTGAVSSLEALSDSLESQAKASLNSHRALSMLTRIASSLNKSSESCTIGEAEVGALIKLCGVSEYFGEMIAANPSLISSVTIPAEVVREREYAKVLESAVMSRADFHSELEALRWAWSALIVEVGACDARSDLSVTELNCLLTRLAQDTLNVALFVARREFERRYGSLSSEPRMAILALGRLGSGGMDYGSDLDIVIVYDSDAPAPLATTTPAETYARLTELVITTLSGITRSGYLYRVDLRLRPDGEKGPLVNSAEALIDYLSRRAGIWEWHAYVKLRAVAGDMSLGAEVEAAARQVVHELALKADANELQSETHRVRNRLEKEKATERSSGIELKYGAGGMLDVYFVARYLQLRDNVPDDDQNRTTRSTLRLLRASGSLAETDFAVLDRGYEALRLVDHQVRLIVGRSKRLPPPSHPACNDIASRLGYSRAEKLIAELNNRMKEIRSTYEKIVGVK